LRPDVAAYAFRRQVAECARALVHRGSFRHGDSKLVLAQARRNVGVSRRVDIGIHADRKTGGNTQPRGHGVEQRQFRFRLAVEAVNAAGERVLHLGGGFSDARKHHLGGIAACLENPEQLAARDDVEARPGLGQQRQHGQRGIGLHGVTDGVRQIAEGFVISAVAFEQRLPRIDVNRCAGPRREIGQRNLLAVEVVL